MIGAFSAMRRAFSTMSGKMIKVIFMLTGFIGTAMNMGGMYFLHLKTKVEGRVSPLGLYWYYAFAYVFLIALQTYALFSGSSQRKMLKWHILAFTTLGLIYTPQDLKTAIGGLPFDYIKTGMALKITGMLLFIFTQLSLLLYFGSTSSSAIHKRLDQ
jgi:hypothetical protein